MAVCTWSHGSTPRQPSRVRTCALLMGSARTVSCERRGALPATFARTHWTPFSTLSRDAATPSRGWVTMLQLTTGHAMHGSWRPLLRPAGHHTHPTTARWQHTPAARASRCVLLPPNAAPFGFVRPLPCPCCARLAARRCSVTRRSAAPSPRPCASALARGQPARRCRPAAPALGNRPRAAPSHLVRPSPSGTRPSRTAW